ncbi:hypothetical protein CUR178_02561 [Leishmania enriettii]|uniref:Uncharacterized protein n=1 Tax=Leishmania enriettii TaxID=5663 RepID=A0A836H6J7_LEIEN|nr:hypothetical protein CUR178_02561 [Leishmania enriettii]
MSRLLFGARYQPEECALEFDLTDAPLVDVVTDVTVAPCGVAAPLWRTPAMQQGLFNGRNSFILDRPLVFADDRVAIVCCLRVRQQRLSTLAAIASNALLGSADESAVHCTDPQDTREYILLFTEVSHTGRDDGQGNGFVYLTSQPLPSLTAGSSTTMGFPLPPQSPTTCLTYAPQRSPPASLLALSAHALCYL